MYKYPVIVFEWIETSGKSTNLKIVSNYLNNRQDLIDVSIEPQLDINGKIYIQQAQNKHNFKVN